MYLSLKFLNKLTSEYLYFCIWKASQTECIPKNLHDFHPKYNSKFHVSSLNEWNPPTPISTTQKSGPTFGASISLTPYIYYIRKFSHVILQIDPNLFIALYFHHHHPSLTQKYMIPGLQQ